MSNSLQAIRGMSDILPSQVALWQYVERTLISIAQQYHYQEIRFPIVEKTDLFARSIGEVTDIIEKEMYVFADRNQDSLALRPEGTAGCVRACIEHGLLYHQTQKLWYMGPMFRHERPQKGRYRQFHQFGAEAFGFPQPEIEVEMLLMTYRFWQVLGLENQVKLEINSLGTLETRQQYRQALVDFYQQHLEELDEDSHRRLQTNPLRILDSKNPKVKALNQQAPSLLDHLDADSLQHFEKITQYLKALNVPYVVNPGLVRGLDYYTKTVFEWVTEDLGAQGTLCAGGRYDGLVQQLGGHATPAVGFALGLERIVALLEDKKFDAHLKALDFYCIALDEQSSYRLFSLLEEVRAHFPQIQFYLSAGETSLKNQLKKADKMAAHYALILGEQELMKQEIILKFLRKDGSQQAIPFSQLNDYLTQLLS